jgi:hypothetical protein
MSLSVSFRHSARAEFIEAAAWYENERQNLGVEFIAEIERCVAAAAERPMTFTADYKDVRRVVAKRSPVIPTTGQDLCKPNTIVFFLDLVVNLIISIPISPSTAKSPDWLIL